MTKREIANLIDSKKSQFNKFLIISSKSNYYLDYSHNKIFYANVKLSNNLFKNEPEQIKIFAHNQKRDNILLGNIDIDDNINLNFNDVYLIDARETK